MFSLKQKQQIAAGIEKILLEINHPEMPKEKPVFKLHVEGKESWSWADIEPNWIYQEGYRTPDVNQWNERQDNQ